jgi:hypothetical protein
MRKSKTVSIAVGVALLIALCMIADSARAQDSQYASTEPHGHSGCIRAEHQACSQASCIISVSLNVASVVGGGPVQGRVILNAVTPYDIEVSLASDPPNLVTMPRTVTIPAGGDSAVFVVDSSKTAVRARDTAVEIYANYNATRHTSLMIRSASHSTRSRIEGVPLLLRP